MKLRTNNDTGVVTLSGTLEIRTVSQIHETLLKFVSTERQVVLDLSEIERCDTAGLQLLFACEKQAVGQSKTFRLQGMSHAVAERAAALGLGLQAEEWK